MKKLWGIVCVGILGLAMLGTSGCENNTTKLLRDEVDHLNQVNMNYEKEVRQLMEQNEAGRLVGLQSDASIEGLQREVALLEERLGSMPRPADPIGRKERELLKSIARQMGGEMIGNRILMPGDFLFNSGSWALKTNARRALKQIAVVLDPERMGLVMMIVGHTDNEPIKKLKKKNITSNRQLSLMRSLAVLNYLQKYCDYPGRLMYPTGWGELKPVASNSTKTGRSRNRRVELWIDPILSNLTPKSAISGVGPAAADAIGAMPADNGGDIVIGRPEASAVIEK